MKVFGLITLFLVALFSVGCNSTATEAERDAYYEDGKMTEQVESWKKHGRY